MNRNLLRAVTLLGLSGLLILPVHAATGASAAAGTDIDRCQSRSAEFDKGLGHITDSSRQLADFFATTESHVETYYGQVAGSGLAVANFPALVKVVAEKRTAVDAAIAKVAGEKIICSQSPTAAIAKLGGDVGQINKSLKEYRAAIRNVIVAVRTKSQAGQTPAPGGDNLPELP